MVKVLLQNFSLEKGGGGLICGVGLSTGTYGISVKVTVTVTLLSQHSPEHVIDS